MEFNIWWLVAAFGGGLAGAVFGALPIFILCGAAAIVGAGLAQATGNATFTNLVAFGPFLGPQISFAGGAAAAIYATRRGKMTNGRDIAVALMGLDSPDVLLVGGLFGVLGYVLWWAFAQFKIGDQVWTNPIALSIVVNAIIARLVFGKTGVFGKVRKGDSRWLPSDVAGWLPWQAQPLQLLTMGLGLGLVVAWSTVQMPALAGVWFGVSALALVFLQFNVKVPVSHHITLAAEQAVVLGGDMWWGVGMAILGAFLGEFYACLFTAHGDSHIDPPSCSLATTLTITVILRATGLLSGISGLSSFIVAAVMAAVAFAIIAALKSRGKPAAARPAAA